MTTTINNGLLAKQLAPRAKTDYKILTIDIERRPGLAYVWDQKTRFIPASAWVRKPSLLCWDAKWYGRKTHMFEAAWKDQDRMVGRLAELLNEADIVVGYNSKRFDVPHINEVLNEAGYNVPSPFKQVDLYAVNNSRFAYESRSMDYLCNRLALAGKQGRYSIQVAEAAMAGDRALRREMKVYNAGDVDATEALYDRLRPWIKNHPYIGGFCNNCGSDSLSDAGTYETKTMAYPMFQCDHCGTYLAASTGGTRITNLRPVA